MIPTLVTMEWLEENLNLSRVEVLETLLGLKEKNLIEVEYLGTRLGETWLEVKVLSRQKRGG